MRVLFMPVPRQGNPYQHELARGLAAHGVEVVMARGYWHVFPFLHAVLMRRRRLDVFHLHWTQPYLYLPGRRRPSRLLAWRLLFQLRVLRRLGVQIVWTVHNIAAHERADAEPELRISRRIAALSDALIVHCEAARRLAIEALAIPTDRQDRVVVVPHGHYIDAYPTTLTRDEARRSFGFAEGERVYLLLGALRGYKGASELIAEFKKLPDPNARLLIAGKPFTPELAADLQARVADEPRIVARLEFIPDVDIPRFLRASDCAVLPFRDVLTSGSLILAMSFGLAAIAPRLGCLPETVAEDGSLLYDAEDPNGLANALQHALTADLAAMGAANRRQIEGISWESVAEATLRSAYGEAGDGDGRISSSNSASETSPS
jgi:beta-1,4-mannosyltransferase